MKGTKNKTREQWVQDFFQDSNNRFLNADRHAHTSPKQFLSLPSAIVAQVTQRFGTLPYVPETQHQMRWLGGMIARATAAAAAAGLFGPPRAIQCIYHIPYNGYIYIYISIHSAP